MKDFREFQQSLDRRKDTVVRKNKNSWIYNWTVLLSVILMRQKRSGKEQRIMKKRWYAAICGLIGILAWLSRDWSHRTSIRKERDRFVKDFYHMVEPEQLENKEQLKEKIYEERVGVYVVPEIIDEDWFVRLGFKNNKFHITTLADGSTVVIYYYWMSGRKVKFFDLRDFE